MLVNGQWTDTFDPIQKQDADGRFVRLSATFRDQELVAEPGRYLLYVALICPWAHRTLITRKLKGLESAIDIAIVEPFLTDFGWGFGDYPGSTPDPIHKSQYMHEIYTRADPQFTGRATVPVLWDKVEGRIANNESADIIRLFNSGLGDLASGPDLRPQDLIDEMDAFNTQLYHDFNNGVYKAGFAQSQKAHDEAIDGVFKTLDDLEARLSDGRSYLFGDRLTESDIRTYVTLVRFDTAYHGAFKTNLRRIQDYPALQAYLERLYAIPAFNSTTNIDHIKAGYYSIRAINPTGIIPNGPGLEWMDKPTDRTEAA